MTANGTPQNAGKIPLEVKIAYGGAEWASSVVFTAYAVYFLIFLTDVVGIRPSVGGGILFAAAMWDAVTDPAMGIISDRTHSRFGRRRPYLLGVAIPFGLIFWMLFSGPPLHGYKLPVYYLVMSLLMHGALTVLDVPYTALAPEMTKDYDERTSLMSFRVVWSQIASIFAAAVPLMIVKQFSDPKTGWSVTGAVFGFLCVFPILLTWRLTRGWERYVEDTEPLNFKDLSRAVFGNRSFRHVIGIYFFSATAVYATGTMAMYFLEYWMNFSESQISLFFLFFFVCTVLWVPIITLVSKRIGKRSAFMLFMGLWAGAYGIGNLIIRPHHVVLMYFLAALGAVGASASFLLCFSMIADVVEVDEFKTGKRREGLYYGVVTFVQKMGSALSLLILGQVLEQIGYVPNTTQSAPVLLGLRILFGPVLAGLILISIVIAIFFPMTRKRHKALLEAIEAKRSGAAWDETGFKELL